MEYIPVRSLYRDRVKGSFGGVCAGLAGYFRRPVWLLRSIALVALVLAPAVTLSAYLLFVLLVDAR